MLTVVFDISDELDDVSWNSLIASHVQVWFKRGNIEKLCESASIGSENRCFWVKVVNGAWASLPQDIDFRGFCVLTIFLCKEYSRKIFF